MQHFFSKPLIKDKELHNLYAIEGKGWRNASVDYTYTHHNFFFFGEAAVDQKGAKAL